MCSSDDTVACSGDTAVQCNGGVAVNTMDCAALGQRCEPGLGCVSCTPGEGTCADGVATVCRPDGTGYQDYECDPVQGMECHPDGCIGTCSWSELGSSYVGCDYYPTMSLNNGLWSGFDFAVALSNVGYGEAHVVVTRGDEEHQRRPSSSPASSPFFGFRGSPSSRAPIPISSVSRSRSGGPAARRAGRVPAFAAISRSRRISSTRSITRSTRRRATA